MTKEQVQRYTDNGVFAAIIAGKPLQYKISNSNTWFDVAGDPALESTTAFRVKPVLLSPIVHRAGDLYTDTKVLRILGSGNAQAGWVRAYSVDPDATVIVVED